MPVLMAATLGLMIFAGAMLYAALNDLVYYQIPNAVILALALAFLLFAMALPWQTALWDVTACAAMLALTAAGFAVRLMGGGDAKLLAAAALWTGWGLLLPFLLLTSLIGGALALLLLVVRRLGPEPAPGRWFARLLTRQGGVPYGIAIGLAGLLLLPQIAQGALH